MHNCGLILQNVSLTHRKWPRKVQDTEYLYLYLEKLCIQSRVWRFFSLPRAKSLIFTSLPLDTAVIELNLKIERGL